MRKKIRCQTRNSDKKETSQGQERDEEKDKKFKEVIKRRRKRISGQKKNTKRRKSGKIKRRRNWTRKRMRKKRRWKNLKTKEEQEEEVGQRRKPCLIVGQVRSGRREILQREESPCQVAGHLCQLLREYERPPPRPPQAPRDQTAAPTTRLPRTILRLRRRHFRRVHVSAALMYTHACTSACMCAYINTYACLYACVLRL